MTNEHDRATLLEIAREAITAHVTGGAGGPERPAQRTEALAALRSRRGGAFVSVHHHGDLRGCIGYIAADRRLTEVIAQCAVSACSADPRFTPVSGSELADIGIELSLLGPLDPISGPDGVEIGRHGLVVERDRSRGLLLPQVATEWKWDALTFLAQTCRKAGLPADAWKLGASIWRFEAEVFR
jgi:AmmeMemoRadiSam system protein A